MVGLIIPQQHVPEVFFQMFFPDFLVTVDRRCGLVGAHPGQINAVHKVTDGENVFRLTVRLLAVTGPWTACKRLRSRLADASPEWSSRRGNV